jgi:hypothetical protein
MSPLIPAIEKRTLDRSPIPTQPSPHKLLRTSLPQITHICGLVNHVIIFDARRDHRSSRDLARL